MEALADPVIRWALGGAALLLALFLLFSWLDRKLAWPESVFYRAPDAPKEYWEDGYEVPVGSEAWVPTPARLEEPEHEPEPDPSPVRYFRGTHLTCPECHADLAVAQRHVYEGEKNRNIHQAFLPMKHYGLTVMHTCPICGTGTSRWNAEVGGTMRVQLHTDTGWE